jgi:CubicO group peptidase (beta-lactamase class C family)
MAKTTHRPLSELDQSLDRRILELLHESHTPGAVITLVRGDEVFIASHGVRDSGARNPVTPGTSFDVGSCSKSFVATAVARLVSEGRLGFDDPVKAVVPELELDDSEITENITIRDLLCNRTGLKRQIPVESFANTEIRVEQIASRLRHLDRQYPFRDGYVYFNPGFMISALVVERVSGAPYERFLEEEIFRPLGMTGSASGLRPFEILSDRAVGHVEISGSQLPITDEPVFDNWQGAGGVFSSGLDAARWLRLHLGANGSGHFDPEVLRELHTPHTRIPDAECKLIHKPPGAGRCDYCMGWWRTDLLGHELVQHAGEMFGWRAHMAFLPGDGVGVAVYTNSSTDPVHHAISYSLLEFALGGSVRDWRSESNEDASRTRRTFVDAVDRAFPFHHGEPSPVEFDRFEGRYRHPACGDVVVSPEGSGFVVTFEDGRLWDTRLTHLGGTVFEAECKRPSVRDYMPAPFRIRFEVEGDRVTALQDLQARYGRVA